MDEPVETWTVAVDADTSELRRELASASQYGRQFGSALTSAFTGVAIQGRALGDVIRSLAASLSRLALNAAFKPVEQGIGSLFSHLFSGGFAFANGAALRQGLPVPFASGGVISAPTTFPLGNGRTGLAGERGAEAILPLARGADGRLGVAASGGGAVSISFNVSSPDADSFQRSEGQIAAMLTRAVARGQRGL